MRWLVVVVALGGCDLAFGLDRTITPTHQLLISPTSDIDNDGVPDGDDLCPLIKNTEIGGNEDRDGDGVGDLCDPNPDDAGDCLGLLDDFSGATLSSHWLSTGGAVTLDASAGHVSLPPGNETVLYLDVPIVLDTLQIGGYTPNGTGKRVAVEVIFDMTRDPLVNGHACAMEGGDGLKSQVTTLEVVHGADTATQNMLVGDGSVHVGAGSNFELAWRGGAVDKSCTASMFSGSKNLSGSVHGAPPKSATIAIRTLGVGLDLSDVVGYGRDCD